MTLVTTTADQLVVEPQGLHRLWGLRRRIVVPLTSVRGATHDPGVLQEPRGVRAPGLHVPGIATVGTYHRDGERHFWDVGRGPGTVVVELVGEHFDRLVVEVRDPRAVVDAVNRAASRA